MKLTKPSSAAVLSILILLVFTLIQTNVYSQSGAPGLKFEKYELPNGLDVIRS